MLVLSMGKDLALPDFKLFNGVIRNLQATRAAIVGSNHF